MAETKKRRRPARRPRRRGRGRARSATADGGAVPLHKRVVSHFQTGDRRRGRDYFDEGRVRLEVEGSRARARVRGTERQSYAVGLDWSRVTAERVLHAFCGCQRFAQGRPCKHVWATLLALDEGWKEAQPPGGDRLKLQRDRQSSWKELGLPAEGEQSSEPGDGNRPRRRSPGGRGRGPAGPTWRSQLDSMRESIEAPQEAAGQSPMASDRAGELRLLINTAACQDSSGLVLDVFSRGSSESAKLRRETLDPEQLGELLRSPGSTDLSEPLEIVTALPPNGPVRQGRGRRGGRRPLTDGIRRLQLPRSLYSSVLPGLCERGILGWWDGRSLNDPHPLSWDGEKPWRLVLRLDVNGSKGARLGGALERDHDRVPLREAILVLPAAGHGEPVHGEPAGGEVAAEGTVTQEVEDRALVLFADSLGRIDLGGERDLQWIEALRETGEILVPRDDLEEALPEVLEMPGLPPLEAPDELQIAEEGSPPRPRVVLEPNPASILPDPPLLVELSFTYGEIEVGAGDPRPSLVDWEKGRFVRRDMEREHQALVRLLELGLEPIPSGKGHELEVNPRDLPTVAEPLLLDGWTVEVRGTSLRPPSPPALRVESGIDWFELSGEVDFAGDPVELRAVLDAVSRGERFIRLGDGSQGLLPSSWMETYDSLAKLAHSESEEGLRFLPSQALFVDALLATMPPPEVDADFARLRDKLQSFEGIKPKKEPRGFAGTLRGYQRHGLGWLEFLREFGLGGVLADDMGLGKTVQVLALLELNRTPSKTSGLPSLVVAPRSLVYNWLDEAQRFTPKLRVVEYLGTEREALQGKLGEYDMVVTTYGTLRRDVGFLATVEFDTVVLDEAQAIKNPESQTAKASRLLGARHRLALTGTPIENHLGELGSIFEFLNPGVLGRLPSLDVLTAGGAPSRAQLELVAKGVRPFILRRTKGQVLKDLPPKTEQVLLCTLPERQRELYDQLRAGYQASLLKQVESEGLAGSTMQVLEALLRLRQVACHPGLVNADWQDAGSAKLEDLYDRVEEVLDEGHKVLVFSQFTKLLAFVRQRFDERGVVYAYLDGQTRNRGEVVERFQTDPSCNVFLISLKAGGVGLNLTAAGYVFLLDPWWNPAVEAQAIDRAHRIGQTQPVFAYRMIARDTVEEKIVELQRAKRQLADTILEGEGQTLGDLTADDLRMLLS